MIPEVSVKAELVCDTPHNRDQQIFLLGCAVATAMTLARRAAAAVGVSRQLANDEVDVERVTIRFASLVGYVLAKAAGVGHGFDRNLYDRAFVLLQNRAGGPMSGGESAFAVLPDPAFSNYAENLRAVPALFEALDAVGSRVRAAQRVRDDEASTSTSWAKTLSVP